MSRYLSTHYNSYFEARRAYFNANSKPPPVSVLDMVKEWYNKYDQSAGDERQEPFQYEMYTSRWKYDMPKEVEEVIKNIAKKQASAMTSNKESLVELAEEAFTYFIDDTAVNIEREKRVRMVETSKTAARDKKLTPKESVDTNRVAISRLSDEAAKLVKAMSDESFTAPDSAKLQKILSDEIKHVETQKEEIMEEDTYLKELRSKYVLQFELCRDAWVIRAPMCAGSSC